MLYLNSVVPMESTPEVSVKIVYNNEMRRFPFAGTSFQALNAKILEVLGLEATTPVVLKYRDEEEDLVTITTDLELKTAIAPGKVLRLDVIPNGSQSATMGVPPVLEPHSPFNQFAAGCDAQAQHTCVPVAFPPFGDPSAHTFGPFVGPAGFCQGKDAWHQYKKEMKNRKKSLSPAEWAEIKQQYNQEKEKHKLAKEHMRSFHKMMKKNGKHALRAAMYGPRGHHGPHGHGPHGFGPRGGFGSHGHGPHGFGPRGGFGPHGPGRFHHGPHAFVPDFQAQGEAVHPSAQDGAPQPEFGHRFGPGFGHPFHHQHPFPQNTEKLVARHVKDVTIEDGTQMPAGTSFVKTWRVRNEGQPWPAGCRLTYNCGKSKGGDNMSGPEYVVVESPVAANEEVDISVPLVAPTKPGRYTGYWKMRTPDDRKFGQRLWVTIVVPSAGSGSSSEEDREADRYEALVDVVLGMGFMFKRHRIFRLVQKYDGDMERVTLKLAEKQQKAERKEVEKAQKASSMSF